MQKKDELRSPTSCLNKAGPEELIFVLRAKDPIAAQTIRHWAAMAEGVHEPHKIKEALCVAEAIEKWHAQQPQAAQERPMHVAV